MSDSDEGPSRQGRIARAFLPWLTRTDTLTRIRVTDSDGYVDSDKSDRLGWILCITLTRTRVADSDGYPRRQGLARTDARATRTPRVREIEGEMDRQRILSKHYGDFDSVVLDRVVESLFEAGAITIEGRTGKTRYAVTEKAKRAMENKE